MAVIRLAPNKAIVGAKITSQVLQYTPPKDTMSHCKDTLPTQTSTRGARRQRSGRSGDWIPQQVYGARLAHSQDLHSMQTCSKHLGERKKEIVSISGLDYVTGTLVVDTL